MNRKNIKLKMKNENFDFVIEEDLEGVGVYLYVLKMENVFMIISKIL